MDDPIAKHHPAERAAYRYMDAFRFIAALAVVVGHARDLVWVDAAQAGPIGPWQQAVYFATGFGHEAVMVFFVLSGFWIAHAVGRRVTSERFWAGYLNDRLSRLLIVIVPGLALGGLFDWYGAAVIGAPQYFGATGAHSVTPNVLAALSPAIFTGNLLFLQTLAVVPFGSNGPLWSLANEFWYYIWFAALARAYRGRPSLALAGLAVALLWPKLLPGFVVWLLGSTLYHLDQRWMGSGREFSPLTARAIAATGAALLAGILALARVQFVDGWLASMLIGLAFAVLLWGLLRGALRFPRALSPVAAYGAGASFSLYVVHYPLILLAVALTGLTVRMAPSAKSLFIVAALTFGAVIAGWIFSRGTELQTGHLRNLVKRRLLRQPAAD